MYKILVFLIPTILSTTFVAKINISYEFLATRTQPLSQFYKMNDLFGKTVQTNFNTHCSNQSRCYFPIVEQNETLVYTMLTDTECSSYPNCTGFTEDQYQNYTIVFSDSKVTADDFTIDDSGEFEF